MKIRTTLLVLLTSFASGCAVLVPLRTSSSAYLDERNQQAELAWSVPTLETHVKQLMQDHGLRLTHALDAPDGSRVLAFTGQRARMLSIKASDAGMRIDSYGFGSWFAVRLRSNGSGSRIAIFGKPTINGAAVCSDDDAKLADVQYWCRDTKVRKDFQHPELVNGQIESEFIGGFLEALRDAERSEPKSTPGVLPI